MRFLPLTYAPITPRERLADQLQRLYYRILMWCSAIPAYTDTQWTFLRTLMRRSVLARHIYFLISTSADCPRSVPEITRSVNEYRADAATNGNTIAIEAVSETDVAAALAELRANGLVDEAHRLRLRILPT